MDMWIQCDAYFSERPRHGPFWLRIAEGKLAEIRTEQPDARACNLGAKAYLLPLLADTHAHVFMDPWPLAPSNRSRPGSEAWEVEVQNGLARLQGALAMGVGFVRDMGDPLGINVEVKRRALANATPCPAYQVPGPAIHRPKKYGRFLGVARETMPEIHALIDELVEQQGIDFVKVTSTGIVDFATRRVKQTPQYTAEELRAVVEHAESLGLRVASHCSGQEGIDNNIAAGVHFVEHAYLIRPDQQSRLRDQGQFWTPTFAPVYQQSVHEECGWDALTRRSLFQILAEHDAAVARGHLDGMRLLAGTDAGSPGVEIGAGLIIELQNMAHTIPWNNVLRTATAGNADACRHPGYTGRLDVGHPASFAVYAVPPWQDASQLGKPERVFLHGAPLSES